MMQRIVNVYNQHPRLTMWAVLAVGMVAILLWSARDVGLLPQQTLALVVATIGLAGLCVWIISWEDEDEPEEESAAQPEAASQATDTPHAR